MRKEILKLRDKRAERGQHPGLLLHRYVCDIVTGEAAKPMEKSAVLASAIRASTDPATTALYRAAFHRWENHISVADSSVRKVRTQGRLVVGLGTPSVIETGIRLNHTFGMPILPGSSLKGLASHYCAKVWGDENKEFQREQGYHRLLFGTTEESGCICFHDAWYVPESAGSPLVNDVMTPHHPTWLEGTIAPTDFDDPNPLPFLAVTGEFLIAVSWCGPESDQAKAWTELTCELLVRALQDWGIGAKKSSDYGRFLDPEKTPAPQKVKRPPGTPAKVRIVSARPKGGFNVQEPGYPPGTLTVHITPEKVEELKQVLTKDPNDSKLTVDVEVHVDDPKTPQYRWPTPKQPPSPPKGNQKKKR